MKSNNCIYSDSDSCLDSNFDTISQKSRKNLARKFIEKIFENPKNKQYEFLIKKFFIRIFESDEQETFRIIESRKYKDIAYNYCIENMKQLYKEIKKIYLEILNTNIEDNDKIMNIINNLLILQIQEFCFWEKELNEIVSKKKKFIFENMI